MRISRRAVLVGAGAALAAGRKPTIAAHPYVYTQHRPDRDINPVLGDVFADVKAAGFAAIELMHSQLAPDDAVARIRELCARNQLPVIGMSYGAAMWSRERHAAILEEFTPLIERLGTVGGRMLGISVGSAGKEPKTEAQLDAQAGLLKRVYSLCRDHGVAPNLHNHVYEVANGEHDLKGTLARLPESKLGPDLNWLKRASVEPVDFIRRHGKRIVYLHLRDQAADGKWTEAMGEGAMDYAAIGRALREAGFSGDAAVELAHEKGAGLTRPLRESLRLSREYVRKSLGW
jgi:sugar phosphate isomerase/epimerase